MTANEQWEAALREANETRRAELIAGGEFGPVVVVAPEGSDPLDRFARSWLASGRGSAGYERNGLEHGHPKKPEKR